MDNRSDNRSEFDLTEALSGKGTVRAASAPLTVEGDRLEDIDLADDTDRPAERD